MGFSWVDCPPVSTSCSPWLLPHATEPCARIGVFNLALSLNAEAKQSAKDLCSSSWAG